MTLSDRQIETYSRQIILREFGGQAQQALLDSSVALHGTDMAAKTAATYLAGAGIGTLLVDDTLHQDATYAPLAERSPDTSMISLGKHGPRADLVILAGVTAPDEPAPRAGSLLAMASPSGGAHLLLLPADGPVCPACVESVAPILDPANAAVTGALAALVALRWLAGIGEPPIMEARELLPGAAAWTTPGWPGPVKCGHRAGH